MLIDIHAWTQIFLTELSRLFAGRLSVHWTAGQLQLR